MKDLNNKTAFITGGSTGIGFGMATIVFTFLTYFILNEVPDTRTIISMILAVIIIMIQLSHVIVG